MHSNLDRINRPKISIWMQESAACSSSISFLNNLLSFVKNSVVILIVPVLAYEIRNVIYYKYTYF